jgi:hypothetical protein
MGVEPFLISSLEAVLGHGCCASVVATRRTRRMTYGVNSAFAPRPWRKQFFYGKGDADNTGYRGRKIYDFCHGSIRELINERAPTVTIKQKAIEFE